MFYPLCRSINYPPLWLFIVLTLSALIPHTAFGAPGKTFSPVMGVVCDRHICANKDGISIAFTQTYLGAKKAAALKAVINQISTTEFTFDNGVFCDTSERLCRVNRYFVNGERADIAHQHTRWLFGQ